jgi:hypothetical protein
MEMKPANQPAGGLLLRLRSVALLALALQLPAHAAAELDAPLSLLNVTRVRVALTPQDVFARSAPNETTVWESACVYESSKPTPIAVLLQLLQSYPRRTPMSAAPLRISHAIELDDGTHRQRMFLSDLMSGPGGTSFLRGRWRGADPLSPLEFETDTGIADGLRDWVIQPGVALSASSPNYCSNLRKP